MGETSAYETNGTAPPRTAVVTGGAGGIGRSIAATLAAHGVRVAVADLDADAAEAVAADLRAAGAEAIGVALDVTDADAVAAAAAAVERRLGPVDIVVNNAGWDDLRAFVETDESFWRRVVDINYLGTLRVTRPVPARHDRARLGAGRQHELGRRARRVLAGGGLRRRQGRRDRLHEVAGARGRHRRRDRQRGLPWPDRHAAAGRHGRRRRARPEGHRRDDAERCR